MDTCRNISKKIKSSLILKFVLGVFNYLKAVFYSKGKPHPVYAYIFVMLVLIAVMVIFRILSAIGRIRSVEPFSDTLILGMCGFVATWAGILTWGEIKKQPSDDDTDTDKEE